MLFTLAWTELRMGVRGAAFRLLAVLCFALGYSVGGAPGRGAGLSAYLAGEAACRYLGLLAIVWMALTAVRDSTLRTDVLVYSKPQPTERLVLARFLGAYGQIVLFLVALLLGAFFSRWFSAGNITGFAAYGLQFLRAAGVLFFAASASHCLALLTESPVAGGVVGLYWIVVMSGRAFLAKGFFPWYTQNLAAYVFLGLFLLGVTLLLYRRQRRGLVPAPLWARLFTPITLLLSVGLLWLTLRYGHDPMVFTNDGLDRMSYQNVVINQRVPGFLLPDQYGRQTALSDFPDKVLVIGLWSPKETESALLLSRLEDIYQKFGAQGVLPVTICLSEDSGAATTFAIGENLSFPAVADWGTHNAATLAESSPLATAYQTDVLPRIVITDRRRRARQFMDGVLAYDVAEIERQLRQRLEEEPE